MEWNAWLGFRAGVILAIALGACGIAALVIAVQVRDGENTSFWGPTTRADVRAQSSATSKLVDALPAQIVAELGNQVAVLSDEVSYATLLSSSKTVASGDKRVVVAYPDGRVLVDTALADSQNTWAHAQAGTVAENHNTRAAPLTSQLFRGGWSYERKRSSTQGDVRTYVSVRLGGFRNSQGTLVISESD